jgi:type IV secretion system protein VirB6
VDLFSVSLDIEALIIWGAAFVVTLPAAAMIISAKGILLLLIGIGPFFIAALMFPVTSKWFDAWFGQAMTQIFTIAFICMIASSAMKIVARTVTNFDPETENVMLDCLILLGECILLLWLMYRAGSLAAALPGGVASSAITFGGMAASAMGLGTTAAKAAASPFKALEQFNFENVLSIYLYGGTEVILCIISLLKCSKQARQGKNKRGG